MKESFNINLEEKHAKAMQAIAITIVLFYLYRINFLFFHILVEGYTIVIAFFIYVMAKIAYKYAENDYLLFIGTAFVYVSVLDFFHTLTYQGMGIFPMLGPDVSVQLWVAARLIFASSLLISPFMIERKVNLCMMHVVFLTLTGIILYSTMLNNVFPVCYLEGMGLTLFKISAEYVTTLILYASLLFLFVKRHAKVPIVYKTMSLSIILAILAELCFSVYRDIYAYEVFCGHMFKVISYGAMYYGTVRIGFDKPYDLIFYNLHKATQTDSLTKVYNRRYFMDKLAEEIVRIQRTGNVFSVIFLDIDDFKTINDCYGHNTGDLVLKMVANVIQARIRGNDTVARWGGEEYVLLLSDTSASNACLVAENIRQRISNMGTPFDEPVTASFGVTEYIDGDTVESIISRADRLMYNAKNRGKNLVWR